MLTAATVATLQPDAGMQFYTVVINKADQINEANVIMSSDCHDDSDSYDNGSISLMPQKRFNSRRANQSRYRDLKAELVYQAINIMSNIETY